MPNNYRSVAKPTKRAIEALHSAIENLEIRRMSYSGRAMFGHKCLGLVVHHREKLSLSGQVVEQVVADFDGSSQRDRERLLAEVVDIFKEAEFDNFGMTDCVVYFRDIPAPHEEPA